jgi:hypothetical protein
MLKWSCSVGGQRLLSLASAFSDELLNVLGQISISDATGSNPLSVIGRDINIAFKPVK